MTKLLSLMIMLPMLTIACDKDQYHHSINKQETKPQPKLDYYEIAYGRREDRPWPPSDAPAKRNPKDVMVNKIIERLHTR